MTEIVVAKRDGVLTAPDGTKYRTHRGKTLADARHPAVQAWPKDWVPMVVELAVDDESSSVAAAPSDDSSVSKRLEEVLDELAESEELADSRGLELQRLADGLRELGAAAPPEGERTTGWVVNLALEMLAERPVAPPVAAPKAPRVRKPPA